MEGSGIAETGVDAGLVESELVEGPGIVETGVDAGLVESELVEGDGIVETGADAGLVDSLLVEGPGIIETGADAGLLESELVEGDGIIETGVDAGLVESELVEGDGIAETGVDAGLVDSELSVEIELLMETPASTKGSTEFVDAATFPTELSVNENKMGNSAEGLSLCTLCNRSVDRREKINAMGKVWHVVCFQCGAGGAGCGKQLYVDDWVSTGVVPKCHDCMATECGLENDPSLTLTHCSNSFFRVPVEDPLVAGTTDNHIIPMENVVSNKLPLSPPSVGVIPDKLPPSIPTVGSVVDKESSPPHAAGKESSKDRVYPADPSDGSSVKAKKCNSRQEDFEWEDHSLYDELVGEPVSVTVSESSAPDDSRVHSNTHSFVSTAVEIQSQAEGQESESDDESNEDAGIFTSIEQSSIGKLANNPGAAIDGLGGPRQISTADDVSSTLNKRIVVEHDVAKSLDIEEVVSPVEITALADTGLEEERAPSGISNQLPPPADVCVDPVIVTASASNEDVAFKDNRINYLDVTASRTSSESVSSTHSSPLSAGKPVAKKLFASAPLCAVCSKAVYKMEEVLAVDKCWHKGCFRCGASSASGGGCNQLLTKDRYESHRGVPYCGMCLQGARFLSPSPGKPLSLASPAKPMSPVTATATATISTTAGKACTSPLVPRDADSRPTAASEQTLAVPSFPEVSRGVPSSPVVSPAVPSSPVVSPAVPSSPVVSPVVPSSPVVSPADNGNPSRNKYTVASPLSIVIPRRKSVEIGSPFHSPLVSSPMKPPSGATRCAACEKVVYKMEEIIAMGISWHKLCFKCGAGVGGGCEDGCGRKLKPDTYFGHRSTLYCQTCYGRVSRAKLSLVDDVADESGNTTLESERCEKEEDDSVSGGIDSASTILGVFSPVADKLRNSSKVEGKVACKANVTTLDERTLTEIDPDNLLTNGNSSSGYSLSKCPACSKSVDQDLKEGVISALNNYWHVACFRCGAGNALESNGCGCLLTHTNFVSRQNVPYCANCTAGTIISHEKSKSAIPPTVVSGADTVRRLTTGTSQKKILIVDDVDEDVGCSMTGQAAANSLHVSEPKEVTSVRSKSISARSSDVKQTKKITIFTSPKCAMCHKAVYKMEEVLAVDKCWHKGCFRCGASSASGGGCNQLLTKDRYESHRGVPYCALCLKGQRTSAATAALAASSGLVGNEVADVEAEARAESLPDPAKESVRAPRIENSSTLDTVSGAWSVPFQPATLSRDPSAKEWSQDRAATPTSSRASSITSLQSVGRSVSRTINEVSRPRVSIGAAVTSPLCAVCSKAVYKMEEVLAVDKCWHKGCFRCGASSVSGGGCNQLLTKDRYESNKGVPYCKQCVFGLRHEVLRGSN